MVDNGQTVSANPPMYKCVQLQSQQRKRIVGLKRFCLSTNEATINGRHTVLYYGLAVTIHGLSNLRGIGLLSVLSINWRTSFIAIRISLTNEYFTDNESGILLLFLVEIIR